MAAKFFRCMNEDCGTRPDFESEKPVCPDCSADGSKHADLIIELTAVHYLVKDIAGPIHTSKGQRLIACMPARARLTKAASGHRDSVTCPKCRASKRFKDDEDWESDQDDGQVSAAIIGKLRAEVAARMAASGAPTPQEG